MFAIFDSGSDGIVVCRDGIACDITLRDQDITMVLLEGDCSFGREREHMFKVPGVEEHPAGAPAVPTASPTPSELIFLVLACIKFDLFHEEMSWKITDASNNSIAFAEVALGSCRVGDRIEEEVRLPPGWTCRFTFQDDFGDGIEGNDAGCSVAVLLAEGDEVMMAEGDGKFEDQRSHVFELPEITGFFPQEGPETSFLLHEPAPFPSRDPADFPQSCFKILGHCTLHEHCCSGRCVCRGCRSSCSSRGGRPKMSGNRGGATGGA
jgi:hypothetical protein